MSFGRGSLEKRFAQVDPLIDSYSMDDQIKVLTLIDTITVTKKIENYSEEQFAKIISFCKKLDDLKLFYCMENITAHSSPNTNAYKRFMFVFRDNILRMSGKILSGEWTQDNILQSIEKQIEEERQEENEASYA
jgi:hypothetical protein